jgi:hypothetical protein
MSEHPTFFSTLNKIKSRGHREVWVKPTNYIENRIESLYRCHEIMSQSRVMLRGWDFPHFSSRVPPYDKVNRVESFLDWDIYKEVWSYNQNGHFFHMTGIKEDWFNPDASIFGKSVWGYASPGSIFGYVNWLYSVTEIYEFVARLARLGVLGYEFNLSIILRGMENRRLVSLDGGFEIRGGHLCNSPTLSFEETYKAGSFALDSRIHALDQAIWLFKQFNIMNPPRDFLEKTQAKFLDGLISPRIGFSRT